MTEVGGGRVDYSFVKDLKNRKGVIEVLERKGFGVDRLRDP